MIELDDDTARLDVARVHAWLASSYWSPGIARATVERAIAGSHCLGAYDDGVQVGFARMITDHAPFAWLADVWVDVPVRGTGLGLAIVKNIVTNHLGSVSVWSADRSGSTFTIRLPRVHSDRPSSPQGAPVRSQQVNGRHARNSEATPVAVEGSQSR